MPPLTGFPARHDAVDVIPGSEKIEALELGMEKGVAFIVDDNLKSAPVVRMRPNKSWHGGDEPGALEG